MPTPPFPDRTMMMLSIVFNLLAIFGSDPVGSDIVKERRRESVWSEEAQEDQNDYFNFSQARIRILFAQRIGKGQSSFVSLFVFFQME